MFLMLPWIWLPVSGTEKRIKPVMSVKRLVYKPTNSFYQVLSSEAFTKHGLNIHVFTLVLKNKIVHSMNPVLRWNFDNVCVETDAAENIKLSKKHSTERIDGAVSTIMALDRAVRNMNVNTSSVYDERGVLVI